MSGPKPPAMFGWVRLYGFISTNPKLAACKDGEFRAWALALALGGNEQVRGRFLNRDYLAAAIGRRLARYIPRLLELGLLTEYEDGMIGVHAFDYWNPPDESNRVRQARWYANNKREAIGLPRLYADGREVRSPNASNVPNALDTIRTDREEQTDKTEQLDAIAALREPSGSVAALSLKDRVGWKPPADWNHRKAAS